MKEDMILCEVWNAIFHPDEQIVMARRMFPVKWVMGIILLTLIGILQGIIWLLTVVPTLINTWVRNWRHI